MTDERHLWCGDCDSQPTVALLDGNETLVCHCTGIDPDFSPVQIHGFDTLPESWEYRVQAAVN